MQRRPRAQHIMGSAAGGGRPQQSIPERADRTLRMTPRATAWPLTQGESPLRQPPQPPSKSGPLAALRFRGHGGPAPRPHGARLPGAPAAPGGRRDRASTACVPAQPGWGRQPGNKSRVETEDGEGEGAGADRRTEREREPILAGKAGGDRDGRGAAAG